MCFQHACPCNPELDVLRIKRGEEILVKFGTQRNWSFVLKTIPNSTFTHFTSVGRGECIS